MSCAARVAGQVIEGHVTANRQSNLNSWTCRPTSQTERVTEWMLQDLRWQKNFESQSRASLYSSGALTFGVAIGLSASLCLPSSTSSGPRLLSELGFGGVSIFCAAALRLRASAKWPKPKTASTISLASYSGRKMAIAPAKQTQSSGPCVHAFVVNIVIDRMHMLCTTYTLHNININGLCTQAAARMKGMLYLPPSPRSAQTQVMC